MIPSIVPPTTVNIFDWKDKLMEHHPQTIECETSGSKPPANITWWKDGQKMSHVQNFVSVVIFTLV